MKEAKHTIGDLRQRQSLPLEAKIKLTKQRIEDWVNEYGEDGVYVSFSGGKDSTVLLHIARSIYPDMKAVFIDTGLEYPEIRNFVKTFENVEWLKPKIKFKEVIEKYGYPFISKEVSECVDGARKYIKSLADRQTDRQTVPYNAFMADLIGIDRIMDKENADYQRIKTGNIPSEPARLKKILGTYEHKEKGVLTGEKSNMYDRSRYKFFLDAPFEISSRCCSVMKKEPAHRYSKETGRKPMTAQMATESKLRTQQWLKNGCNGFDMKTPISNPMAFWTEQDVLLYIHINKIPIASVYGEVVKDCEAEGQLDGQMDMSELSEKFGIFDNVIPVLKTSGVGRTGCMFCGYGCHLEKSPNRFEKMKETHPKQYEYIMKPKEEGGLNYKAVIDWINKNGNMNIKY